MDAYSEESVPEAAMGQSKKSLFSTEKDARALIDVKVPSTENHANSACVNACTDEVQNCRQFAATHTVILQESKQ